MGLLPDTSNWGLYMRRECRERFPRRRLQRKRLVSDPGMYHGTCGTHVLWCMSGSLTRGGENVPGIPVACATRNFTYLARGPWVNILLTLFEPFMSVESNVYSLRAPVAESRQINEHAQICRTTKYDLHGRIVYYSHIDSLVPDSSNSNALAMELLQSGTKPSNLCIS